MPIEWIIENDLLSVRENETEKRQKSMIELNDFR